MKNLPAHIVSLFLYFFPRFTFPVNLFYLNIFIFQPSSASVYPLSHCFIAKFLAIFPGMLFYLFLPLIRFLKRCNLHTYLQLLDYLKHYFNFYQPNFARQMKIGHDYLASKNIKMCYIQNCVPKLHPNPYLFYILQLFYSNFSQLYVILFFLNLSLKLRLVFPLRIFFRHHHLLSLFCFFSIYYLLFLHLSRYLSFTF